MNDINRFSRTDLLDSLGKLLPEDWHPSEMETVVAEDPFSSHPVLSIRLSDALHAARRSAALVAERSSDRQMILNLVMLADQTVSVRPSISGDPDRARRNAVLTGLRDQAERMLTRADTDEERERSLRIIESLRTRGLTEHQFDDERNSPAELKSRTRFIHSMARIARGYGLTIDHSVNRSGPRIVCSPFVELLQIVGEAAGFEYSAHEWSKFSETALET